MKLQTTSVPEKCTWAKNFTFSAILALLTALSFYGESKSGLIELLGYHLYFSSILIIIIFFSVLAGLAFLAFSNFSRWKSYWFLPLLISLSASLFSVRELPRGFWVLGDDLAISFTAQSLAKTHSAVFPLQQIQTSEGMKTIEFGLDKRPPLFSGLIALPNLIFGWDPHRGSDLNAAIYFSTLLIAGVFVSAITQSHWGALASLALIQPHLLRSSRASGLDLLFSGLLMLAGMISMFPRKRNPLRALPWLALGIYLLISYTRYEGILFAIPFLLGISLNKPPPKLLLILSGPLLALSLVMNLRYATTRELYETGPQAALFGWSYVQANWHNLTHGLLTLDRPFHRVTLLILILGSIYAFTRKNISLRTWLIVTFGHFVFFLSYYFSNYLNPFFTRFFFPEFFFFAIVGAVGLCHLSKKFLPFGLIATGALIMTAIQSMSMAKWEDTRAPMVATSIHHFFLEQTHHFPEQSTLYVHFEPAYFTFYGLSAARLEKDNFTLIQQAAQRGHVVSFHLPGHPMNTKPEELGLLERPLQTALLPNQRVIHSTEWVTLEQWLTPSVKSCASWMTSKL